jgi:hypothetical protein
MYDAQVIGTRNAAVQPTAVERISPVLTTSEQGSFGRWRKQGNQLEYAAAAPVAEAPLIQRGSNVVEFVIAGPTIEVGEVMVAPTTLAETFVAPTTVYGIPTTADGIPTTRYGIPTTSMENVQVM